MSALPNGFSGRKFWGTQLTDPKQRFHINVAKSTELHISKAILQYKNPLELHNVQRTINIFVEYFDEVRCYTYSLIGTDGIPSRDHMAMSWSNHRIDDDGKFVNTREKHTCLVCSLNTQVKREADLDLNFVAEKRTLCVYFDFESDDSECIIDGTIVNLSGYVVGG